MKKISRTMVITLFTISTLLLTAGCTTNRKNETKNTVSVVAEEQTKKTDDTGIKERRKDSREQKEKQEVKKRPVKKAEKETVKQEDSIATIVSFGDALCHMPVNNAAYDKETGDYDYTPMFKYVEKYFKNSTVNIGNCESPMAGADKGYSGYPTFNAPEHLSVDLKELGVDIMTTSNNHSLDKGFSGLASTLDFLDKSEISHVGTARTEEEQNTILFKDLNGIKTAFLAYTYGTNGIPVPENKNFCVNLIEKNFMLKQIEQAKNEGAELIIASMHWGVEYQNIENQEQDELAEFLIKNDVKIILGSHAHVLQPMKLLKFYDEEGKEKEGIVIFSQGNFFSNQTQKNTQNTAIFNIEVKKNGKSGEVTVTKATYIPIYVNRKEPGAKDRYELLDLNEIIRSYESGENIWLENMYKLAIQERKKCIEIIGPEIIN